LHKLTQLCKQGKAQGLRVAKKSLTGNDALTEITILKALRHALLHEREEIRIATSISIITDQLGVHHAISLCAKTDLDKLLVKETTIQDHDIMDAIKEIKGIAGALNFLHRKLERKTDDRVTVYCHLDIKPANILVFGKNETDFPVGQWKVMDFGISSISQPTKKATAGGARENGTPRITYTVGTHVRQQGGKYQAPEVSKVKEDDMGRGSDIWSLGCIFAEVLAANLGAVVALREGMASKNNGSFFQPAFLKTKSILNSAFENWLKELPSKAPPRAALLKDCQILIKKMMEIKRIRRISSERLLQDLDNLGRGLGMSSRKVGGYRDKD
jgi:serine/threonine protein kinase